MPTSFDLTLTHCSQISVSTWADALDALGIEGVMKGVKRRSGTGCFAAYAATARHLSGVLHDFDRADFAVGKLVAATGPGIALLIDPGGALASTFGGIAAMATARRNATAVIIDGACRDIDEIEQTGLWLASRHVTPTTGKTRLCLREMGGRIRIGGVDVEPGDLVIGDATGLAVVPKLHIEPALKIARELLEVDERVEQGIHSGMSFSQAAAAANYIPNKAE